MDEEGLKLLQDLSDVSEDARKHVEQLQALAEAETLGEQWSSQVTRCQTHISDALKRLSYLMFELEIMVEEEDRFAHQPALLMSTLGMYAFASASYASIASRGVQTRCSHR